MSEFDSSSAAFDPPALITSRDLIVLAERPEGRPAGEPQKAAANKLFSSQFGVAAAALAIVAAVAGALFVEDSQQAKALAEQASENAALAHTVKSLEARLDAIDSATSNAGLADLRQSVGEIRSSLVSTREFSGALAQLSQRVDKLDHEASARADKLTAGLSTRMDKLEQKITAPPPAPPQAAQAKQPPIRPKFDNVAMDRTSSIERPRPLLRGYVVLDARDDIALVGGRYGEREVRQGDYLPGAGRVERIELGGNGWIVTTSTGLIASADFPRN